MLNKVLIIYTLKKVITGSFCFTNFFKSQSLLIQVVSLYVTQWYNTVQSLIHKSSSYSALLKLISTIHF